jgi:16S rRNA (uracil1498-N3)-methyltransferase
MNESPSLFVPSKSITLFASVIKKDHFELVVEKATELGVNTIQPVLSARSEKKSLNHDRLVRIATEASEQCGRGNVPTILPVAQLEQVLHAEKIENKSKKIVFHTSASKIKIQEIQEFQNIDIYIGPEGGWTDEEIQLFISKGFDVVGLGHQILRAETASIASLSILTLL